jgi:hypothetical protein
MAGSWRESRVALVAAALALLGGTPAVLAAAGVRNPWVLGGAAAVAAVVVVFAAVWQDRYKRLAERRDQESFRTEDGCLVLADGRLPQVRDITDPALLGVHRAASAAVPADGGGRAGEHVRAYVPRDADGGLRERLAAGGFVLLVGDSAAGKSRAAVEAVAATLPGHLLVCPSGRDAAAVAVSRAAQARQSVLWLDDLERYLGTGGLTAAQVGRLLAGTGGHRVVIGTLRAAEQARITADAASGDDAAVQALREVRQVLDLAAAIRLPRMFSGLELDRARTRDWDPRVAEALAHSGSYGIAEYLSAGPELLRDWEDARNSAAAPPHPGPAPTTTNSAPAARATPPPSASSPTAWSASSTAASKPALSTTSTPRGGTTTKINKLPA